jgi:hypothetical protein
VQDFPCRVVKCSSQLALQSALLSIPFRRRLCTRVARRAGHPHDLAPPTCPVALVQTPMLSKFFSSQGMTCAKISSSARCLFPRVFSCIATGTLSLREAPFDTTRSFHAITNAISCAFKTSLRVNCWKLCTDGMQDNHMTIKSLLLRRQRVRATVKARPNSQARVNAFQWCERWTIC